MKIRTLKLRWNEQNCRYDFLDVKGNAVLDCYTIMDDGVPDCVNIKKFFEFDSMINLRPSQGNKSRGVENLEIQKKIIEIVNKLVIRHLHNKLHS